MNQAAQHIEVHAIAFRDRFILYRPRVRLAFVGNRAMAELVLQQDPDRLRADRAVAAFLDSIGFWRPDPPLPRPWRPTASHRPTMAVLLLTTRCNLRCTYCYARTDDNIPLDLRFDLAARAVDAACENARKRKQDRFSLAFHGGGEPTVHWDLLESAVRYARKKPVPCDISMSTNGVWTARQRAFILEHFSGLSLSFDGLKPVQDRQRPRANGAGSFQAVMRTIRALDAAGKTYGIRMTATDRSFADMPETVRFLCEKTGCRTIQVEPCYGPGQAVHRAPSSRQAEAFSNRFMQAFEIAARGGRHLFYSGARPWIVGNAFCKALEDALVVTPEGDVVACFETHSRRHPLTDRLTIGAVDERGVRIDRKKLEAHAAARGAIDPACEGCFCRWHCAGDCATRCLSRPAKDRGRCLVNRTITRETLAWYIAMGGGVWQGESSWQRTAG